VQAKPDPANSFFRSFAKEWVPEIHAQFVDQIAPLVPPTKAIALQTSIKNDLMAPILAAYRKELQLLSVNHTFSAFDVLSSWIFVAEKQWIHWGTNVLPAILKDDHMYLFLLNISVKRGVEKIGDLKGDDDNHSQDSQYYFDGIYLFILNFSNG
jgi:hypothetical protein